MEDEAPDWFKIALEMSAEVSRAGAAERGILAPGQLRGVACVLCDSWRAHTDGCVNSEVSPRHTSSKSEPPTSRNPDLSEGSFGERDKFMFTGHSWARIQKSEWVPISSESFF